MKAASSIALGLLAVGCTDPAVGPDDNDTPSTSARVRVAHLSPDAPAVDFCVAAHGTDTWAGPVMAGAGGPLGLAYSQVTKYLDLEAQQYDVRLVAPGSADCTRGIVPDFTTLPALPDGATATIAAMGNLMHGGAAQFTLRAYIDDAVPVAGKSRLRFIHTSPGTPSVDVGIGGGVLFQPVFSNIGYGKDEYITADPATNLELSARANGTSTDVLAIKPATLAADSTATAFAIGEIGNATAPLRVLLCKDSAPAHMLFTECNVVGDAPERASVRVAHLGPDAPPVDVCLAKAGSNAWQGPLLQALGGDDGLAYSKITKYIDLPITAYDVRVVLANATDCATPAVPDTQNIALAPNLTATIAAIGILDRSGYAAHDPAFRLKVFVDDDYVSSGKTKLRFVHASPSTPTVDVGLGSGDAYTNIFNDVAFSNTATNSPMNDRGYVETVPFTSQISARVAATPTYDALTVHVSLSTGTIATAFAIGGKTGTHINPLRVLVCNDNGAAMGLLSQCSIAN
jgi:hypothetical protein